jgi:hypothetical protein
MLLRRKLKNNNSLLQQLNNNNNLLLQNKTKIRMILALILNSLPVYQKSLEENLSKMNSLGIEILEFNNNRYSHLIEKLSRWI